MIYTLPLLALIFWSDYKRHIIPNNALIGLSVIALIISIINQSIPSALLGGIIGLALMALLKIVGQKGVGYGDVKLSGATGLISGVNYVWWVFVLSWVIAAVSVAFIQKKRGTIPGERFPFGSAICVSVSLYVIVNALGITPR